jgi:hypothetical protein
MENEQLNDYISKARQSGLNDEQIKTELIKTGWQEVQIQDALQPAHTVNTSAKAKKPVMKMVVIVLAILIIVGVGYTAQYYWQAGLTNLPLPRPTDSDISNESDSMTRGEVQTQEKAKDAATRNYPDDYILQADEIPNEFGLASISDLQKLGEGQWMEDMGVKMLPGYVKNYEEVLYKDADLSKIKAVYLALYLSDFRELIMVYAIQFNSPGDTELEKTKMIASIDEDESFLIGHDIAIAIAVDPDETHMRNIANNLAKSFSDRLDIQKLSSDTVEGVPEEISQVGRCYDKAIKNFTELRDSKAQRQDTVIVSDFDYAFSTTLSRCLIEIKSSSSIGALYQIVEIGKTEPHAFYYDMDDGFIRGFAETSGMSLDEARESFGGFDTLNEYQKEKERLFQ